MAISPLGNLTFINQNLQVGASMQAGTQHREDVANLANMQDFQEKLEGVEEIRKLEENESLNPDRDPQKQDQEEHQKNKSPKKQDEQHAQGGHLFDVRA